MFADAPPPPPPAWTATQAQQADLDCLIWARAAAASSVALPGVDARKMAQAFTARLTQSDPTRDWTASAPNHADVLYGWYIGQSLTCPKRLANPPGLTPPPADDIRASLWLDAEQAQFNAVIEDGPVGYRFAIRCVRGCLPPTQYAETVTDTPISLVRLWDGDNLIYSVWAGGSAYRVRVWSVGLAGVSKLLEASTRDRPAFTTGPNGEPEVRTYEADGGTQPRQEVVWRYEGERFTRAEVTRTR